MLFGNYVTQFVLMVSNSGSNLADVLPKPHEYLKILYFH